MNRDDAWALVCEHVQNPGLRNHMRAVEIAMLHQVPVRVLSTFKPEAGGTLVCDEDEIMEKKPVSGIAYSRDEAKITLHRIDDKPGIAASIFGPLADAGVNVDMIVQNVSPPPRPIVVIRLSGASP